MLLRRWYPELYLAIVTLMLAWVLDNQGWLAWPLPVTAYLGWQLWQLRRLLRLLHQPDNDHNPEPAGICGVIYDHLYRLQRVTEQRERQLSKRIQRFEESSASLPDGVVALDPKGQVEWFNAPAGRLLGLTAADLGLPIINVVRNPRFLQFCQTPELTATADIPAPKNNRVQLQLLKVSDGGQRTLLVVRNITKLRHLEQVRRDFVANASHELRTPLTVVHGYLQTMAVDQSLPTDWQKPVEQMLQQTQRMQGIIADMLALAALEDREQPATEADVAVDKLLEEVRQGAERLSSGNHELVVDIGSDQRLRGAEKELHSAVANLAYNAVQHTAPGSRISLGWRIDDQGRGCLRVGDNGTGIAAQHLERLTERFYRIDPDRSRATGGTGLGLAIVKHVATLHGAQLIITSNPGEGSCFELQFPASRVVED